MPRIFKIHPALGVARVGNAEGDDSFFDGPETPGVPANWDFTSSPPSFNPFKKPDGTIKRQAARFRVWEYEPQPDGTLRPLGEVTPGQGGIVSVRWTVHLANRKAAFFQFDGQKGVDDNFQGRPLRNAENPDWQRAIDPGAVTISGPSAGPIALANLDPLTSKAIPSLGELRTDEIGRLRVLGGRGNTAQLVGAAELHNYVNNDGWFDDVGDGPVQASVAVQLPGGGTEQVDATSAWVTVGPPDFAPAIANVVSLYDTMWDIALRGDEVGNQVLLPAVQSEVLERLKTQRADWDPSTNRFKTYRPSFDLEIAPILQRAFSATYVHGPPDAGRFHQTFRVPDILATLGDPTKAADERKVIFDGRVRDPDGTNPGAARMPKGLGDEYADESVLAPDAPALKNPRRFFSLTRYQYALLERWANGNFEAGTGASSIPTAETISPDGLDLAALEGCVGGPFFPGIEVSWMVRKVSIYAEPFRLGLGKATGPVVVGPGFFTQQMALPWQADFRDCQREGVTDPLDGTQTFAMWWAGQRPDDTFDVDLNRQPWLRPPHFNAGDDDQPRFREMVEGWFTLGFVAKQVGVTWVETDGT